MGNTSKRFRTLSEKVASDKRYIPLEGLELIKQCATAKFDESIDIAVNLGIDAKKTDQGVRGSVVLPAGSGKNVRVAVFAQGEQATEAEKAGAERVGFEDLSQDIQDGKIDFDLLIATPDSMPMVSRLGKILGPKGLMPNPKVGTVTSDVARAVQDAKKGQVQFRNDKAGVVHCSLGKASFSVDALKDNLETFFASLIKLKPIGAKGVYIKKITLSSTMGPSIDLDCSGFIV